MAHARSYIPARCLITGLAGFTGRYVAEVMRNGGYGVFGLNDASLGASTDLLDLPAVRKRVMEVEPDIVLHLAAVSFVAHGDVRSIYATNVVGTRNLLLALSEQEKPIRHVILASSANIYGGAAGVPVTEDTPPSPQNDYAVSKLAMEYMAKIWEGELPITITRPFNYTGVGQAKHFLVPKIVDHFRRGEKSIELGNLDVERDFSDVRSVADAYAALVERTDSGGVFNICSGQGRSLKEIIATLESIAGYTIEVKVNPSFVRANEVKRLVGDSSRLDAVMGARASTPFTNTLRWMFEA